MLFQLLKGRHIENGVTYEARDRQKNIVESNDNLEKKFGPEKFRKVQADDFEDIQERARSAKKSKAPRKEAEAGRDDPAEEAPAKASAPKSAKAAKAKKADLVEQYGNDVTDQFDYAEEAGVTVHSDGTKYTVLDDGNPVNDEEITTKKALRKFVTSYNE